MFSKSLTKDLAAGLGAVAAMGLLSTGLATPAAAEGPEFSANVAITSDYIFRGFSQSAEHAAIQGGFDATAGIVYAGVWASSLDFGGNATGDIADIEVDLYAGITPKLGPVSLDLGFIYYAYPDAQDAAAELNFVEFKAGYSTNAFFENLTTGTTIYYSPEYTGAAGKVWTFESTAALTLPKLGSISPSISGTFATVKGQSSNANFVSVVGNGDDSYAYWNAGISADFLEKFSIDLRYWDTNIADTGNFCTGTTFQCDQRFVATLSASF